MSESQAADFATRYTVVDQYTDPASGFSATVFQDAQGKRSLAIRGTSDVMDVIEDSPVGWARFCAHQQECDQPL